MKKTVFAFVMILCMVFAPLTVSAGSYEISGTDMTVNLDESVWYVFTRDNLAGNPELDELGLDYAEMVDAMYNDDIYLYASRYFYEYGSYLDLYVQKWQQEFYWNFIEYSDSELLEIGKSTYEGLASDENTSIYVNPYNHYKYFVIEYEYDGETLLQYETIINSTTYSFQFWSNGTFTEEKYEIAKGIMDAVQFQTEASSDGEKERALPEWLALFLDLKWVWVAVAVVTALILFVGVRLESKQGGKAEPTDTDVDNENAAEEDVKTEDETENT